MVTVHTGAETIQGRKIFKGGIDDLLERPVGMGYEFFGVSSAANYLWPIGHLANILLNYFGLMTFDLSIAISEEQGKEQLSLANFVT